MKLKFTIVIFLLLHNFVSSAQLNQLLGSSSNQSLTSKSGKTAHSGSPKSSKSKNNITGIWRGYFIQKDYNPRTGKFEEDRYKYEVQINNLSNNSYCVGIWLFNIPLKLSLTDPKLNVKFANNAI